VKKLSFIGVIVVLTGLSACSQKNREPFRDAPTLGTHDRTPARIIEMPDGFSNIATKCVDGVRYTVAYHGDRSYSSINVSDTCGGNTR
jgi:hypothetical protein